MNFNYSTSPVQDESIALAREAYNLANPDNIKPTNEDYLTFVLENAIASWGVQHKSEAGKLRRQLQERDAALTEKDAEISALKQPRKPVALEVG